jgi:hypothetical protein
MRQLAAIVVLLAAAPAWGQARLVQAQGPVTIDGRPAAAGVELAQGRIQTGPGASAQLRFVDGTLLLLGAGTDLSLPAASATRL